MVLAVPSVSSPFCFPEIPTYTQMQLIRLEYHRTMFYIVDYRPVILNEMKDLILVAYSRGSCAYGSPRPRQWVIARMHPFFLDATKQSHIY